MTATSITWKLVGIPPSVNHAWRRRGGRYFRGKNYQHWLDVNLFAAKRLNSNTMLSPVTVTILIEGGSGFRVNRDLDNLGKTTLDMIRHAGLIEDDDVRHVRKIVLEYHPPKSKRKPAECWVTIENYLCRTLARQTR